MSEDYNVIADFMQQLQRDDDLAHDLANAIRKRRFEEIAKIVSKILIAIGRAIDDVINFVRDARGNLAEFLRNIFS